MEKDEINNLTKHNRFLRKLEAKRPGQYHTLDIYQSFDENMTFICNHCGYVTSAKPKTYNSTFHILEASEARIESLIGWLSQCPLFV